MSVASVHPIKVVRIGEAREWKDRLAGWARYRVEYTCRGCGKTKKYLVLGTYHSLKAQSPICDPCLDWLDTQSVSN